MLGIKIREARVGKGLSQSQLSNLLVCDQKTVSNWETGKAIPNGIFFKGLSDFLGLSPDLLADLATAASEPEMESR